MNILFDGNYLYHKSYSIFTSYFRGKDMNEVLANPENQQVLIRKCIMDMCFAINKFEDVDEVLFVIDSSNWRKACYDDYKYSLTRVRDESYKYFLIVLDLFESILREKGFIVSRVKGAEGDDLMYMWSVYFEEMNKELVIITGDSDIRQLISPNVSIFNNNSKNMKFFCTKENEETWNDYFNGDVKVEPTAPFEVLLQKVIMGDTSDNIPKLKRGFGPKAFEKFIESITPYHVDEDLDLTQMASWMTSKFCEYLKLDKKEVFEKILFNLKFTWLSFYVYNEIDYKSDNGKSLLENMTDDIIIQKDKYKYKGKYTLENIYNLLIK